MIRLIRRCEAFVRRGGAAPILIATLLLVAGCASTADPRVSSGGTSTVVTFPGQRAAIMDTESASVAPTLLPAPLDEAWDALLVALPAVGVPVTTVHEASWTAGNQVLNLRRRLGDRPLSNFLTCGGSAGVAEIADSYAVTMGVLATLTPAEGGTRLQVQVAGSAKDPFTSVPARHCVSRGRLEAALDSTMRATLSAR